MQSEREKLNSILTCYGLVYKTSLVEHLEKHILSEKAKSKQEGVDEVSERYENLYTKIDDKQ